MDDLDIIAAGSGAHHAVAGARWTWKVRPEQADGAFCFFEMTLAPGEGVPAHRHAYPEAFYVVEGSIRFHGTAGEEARDACGRGDVVLARAGTGHRFFNPGPGPARLLSISTAAHAGFFDAIVEADRKLAFSDLPAPEAFARVVEIGARTGTLFAAEQRSDDTPG
jgi:mannose-6-phosphate isomerase-like protein (cupin superfamily)